ncbi:hypothetical protein IJ670_03780, partial [bacterium]|nr:hypothetical protein [bacterium]
MRINSLGFNFSNFKTLNQKSKYTPQFRPLEQDTFERHLNPILSFKASPSSQFLVRKLDNLYCPVCGLLMLNENQINEFIEDVSSNKGEDLAFALSKYEDDYVFTGVHQDSPKTIFRPQKQKIVNILKSLAEQNPNLNLAQLVSLEADKRLLDLQNSQLEIIKRLEDYIEQSHLPEDTKQEIGEIINKYSLQIKNESAEPFSRAKFIAEISNVRMYQRASKNIAKILEKFPTSDNNIDLFFVKYRHSKKPKEIALKLVAESSPTAEHLITQSENGSSSDRNFICDCGSCNSKRGNVPFSDWYRNIPNFQENLQFYLEQVQDAVNSGLIPQTYSNYVTNIILKISKLSKGAILLEAPKNMPVNSKEKFYSQRKSKLDAAMSVQDDRKQHLAQLKENLATLESFENFQYIREYFETCAEISRLNVLLTVKNNNLKPQQIAQYQEKLTKAKSKLETLSGFFEMPDLMQTKLTHFEEKMDEIEAIQDNMELINSNLSKIQRLALRKAHIEGEIVKMQEENSLISSNADFDTENSSDYEKYLSDLSLLNTA